MKWKVGKEIPSEYSSYKYFKCPKCKGELVAKNGYNSYAGFVPNAAINYFQCLKCKRKFEAIEE